MSRAGRPSIFRRKKHRIQGLLNDSGKRAFDRHRADLERISGKTASHGDVVIYLALGPAKIKKLAAQQGWRL